MKVNSPQTMDLHSVDLIRRWEFTKQLGPCGEKLIPKVEVYFFLDPYEALSPAEQVTCRTFTLDFYETRRQLSTAKTYGKNRTKGDHMI